MRLGRIAFVADRRRHQPAEHPALGAQVRRGALALPKLVHVARRGEHRRPVAVQRGAVAGEAVELADKEDIFAVAVVLRHRVGAAPVDAARHLAALEQIGPVPIGEAARDVGAAHAEQRFGHHRAVADPGAVVAARAGLEHRSVAAGENLRECRRHRVGYRLLRWRDAQFHPPQHAAPNACAAASAESHHGAASAGAGHRQDDPVACARHKVETVGEVGGGHVLARQRADRRGVGRAAGNQHASHGRVAFGLRLRSPAGRRRGTIRAIGLAPPRWARNCAGGLTCHGRIPSRNSIVRRAPEILVSL